MQWYRVNLVLIAALCVLWGVSAQSGGVWEERRGAADTPHCFASMAGAISGREDEYIASFRSLLDRIRRSKSGERRVLEAFWGKKYAEWAEEECFETEVSADPSVHPARFGAAAPVGPDTHLLENKSENVVAGGVESECAALADLFDATNGMNWRAQKGWLNRSALLLDCCRAVGVQCNNESHVTSLILDSNNAVGPIPRSISALTHLTHLYGICVDQLPSSAADADMVWTYCRDLQNNLISSIPPEMGLLTRLEYLSVMPLSAAVSYR